MKVEIRITGPCLIGGVEYLAIRGSFCEEFSEKEDYNNIVRELLGKIESTDKRLVR